MRTGIKKLLFILGVVVGAALILEVGFRLRDWRQNMALTPPASESGAKTVLLIGDSVLGTAPDVGLTRYLESELRRGSGEPFVVRNLSRSKNSSVWVDAYLSDYLRDYHPQYVVLLLGKGDTRESKRGEDEGSWWRDLKIYRLYELILESAGTVAQKLRQGHTASENALEFERVEMLQDWYVRGRREAIEELASRPASAFPKGSDKYYLFCLATAMQAPARMDLVTQAKECVLEMDKAPVSPAFLSSIKSELGRSLYQLGETEEARRWFEEALNLNPDNLLARVELGFISAERHQCGKTISYFKGALAKMARGLDSICFDLYKCFVAEKREKEGEAFFAELSRSRPGLCPKHALTALRGQRAGYVGYNETILNPKDRGEFLAKLYYFRQRYDAGGAAEKKDFAERARLWFQRSEDSLEVRGQTLNQKLFDRILERLGRKGIKTLVLGYPDLPDTRLSESVAGLGENFQFLSLHAMTIEASAKEPLFELLRDDFVHFTDRGDQLAAAAISRALLNFTPPKP